MLNQSLVKLNFPLQNDIVFAGKKDVLFVDKSMTIFRIQQYRYSFIQLCCFKLCITTFLYPHYTKSTYRYYYLRKEGFIFYPNSNTVFSYLVFIHHLWITQDGLTLGHSLQDLF